MHDRLSGLIFALINGGLWQLRKYDICFHDIERVARYHSYDDVADKGSGFHERRGFRVRTNPVATVENVVRTLKYRFLRIKNRSL